MALATPFLPFLPLAAKQILLNNFLSDIPSIAISTDNVDPDSITRPQRWSIKDIQRFMIVFGSISSAFDLLTFAVLLLVFRAGEATFQTSWFMISLLTELSVVLGVADPQTRLTGARPSRVLLWSTITVVIMTFAHSIPWRSECGVRLCADLSPPDGRRRRDCHWLYRGDRGGEGMVLPSVRTAQAPSKTLTCYSATVSGDPNSRKSV